jgi:hypothetical protein
VVHRGSIVAVTLIRTGSNAALRVEVAARQTTEWSERLCRGPGLAPAVRRRRGRLGWHPTRLSLTEAMNLLINKIKCVGG